MSIYAYITNESCQRIDAVKPGALIGRDEIPVSRHGDYQPWTHAKIETRRMINNGTTNYQRRAAREVIQLLGWKNK